MCFYSIENDMQNFRHFCKKKKNTSDRHLTWFCTQPFNYDYSYFKNSVLWCKCASWSSVILVDRFNMLTVIFKVSLLFQYEIGVTMAYMAQSARCLTSFYCTFCSSLVFMLTGIGVSGVENPGKLSTDETLTTCFTWVKIYGRTKEKKRHFCDSMRYKLLSGPFFM